jgi:putative spermidine/putrescine transport system substrate-binding protein
VNIINDESSAEAVAKLRAMNEAGNITWDLVDVVAADAMRLCDEGLAMESTRRDGWRPRRTARRVRRFRRPAGFECFIPQIVYSTTFGYRTDVEDWGGKTRRHLRRVRH